MQDMDPYESDTDMDHQSSFDDHEERETSLTPTCNASDSTVKVRKKPGRKPNPASPALRKAQNRAAQRAFRERKERHMRELEVQVKYFQEQRDRLQAENDHLKSESDILRSENWYLKGIILTLQLVCLRHQLVIPQHNPYMDEETLSVLAQSIPEPIAAYMNVNAKSKLPTLSSMHDFGRRNQPLSRESYISSGPLFVTKDGVHSVTEPVCLAPASPAGIRLTRPDENPVLSTAGDNAAYPTNNNVIHPLQTMITTKHPVQDNKSSETTREQSPHPTPPLYREPPEFAKHPVEANLAAIQILRLRFRLQSVCVQNDNSMFAIQPTILQLTVPHDPRIDLIPTPHMRDRMIMFRDMFDLEDCFRCLIGHAVFHGGDPALASNWELPADFFDKYWFLTTDYQLRRITNKWRTLQGLDKLGEHPPPAQAEGATPDTIATSMDPLLDMPLLDMPVLDMPLFDSSPTQEQPSLFLNGIDTFLPQDLFVEHDVRPDSSSSTASIHSVPNEPSDDTSEPQFFGPIQLTSGLANVTASKQETANDTSQLWDTLVNVMDD